MHALGVIPARGGSKGLPRKNLASLGGRPLLSYTCEAACGSRELGRVVLSTDDEEISEVGRRCGVEVPFRRPADLARDETPMIDVLQHAVRTLEERDRYRADIVVLLQPTSPLRRAEHIDATVRIVRDTGADSAVSVVEVPHQFTPVSVLRLEGERLVAYSNSSVITRRQDKPRVYARNGPAVLAVRRAVVMDQNSLYGADSRPFVMSPEDSFDVDTPWDLELVGLVLTRRAAAGHGPNPVR
jgi:CMP-N,N'-diacetyllegionaminic acid synthase